MTAKRVDVPRTLRARHQAEEAENARQLARILARSEPEQRHAVTLDPAGKRALRGIPVIGHGGLDDRQNPLYVLLARESRRWAA